jgi:hypothetical protein
MLKDVTGLLVYTANTVLYRVKKRAEFVIGIKGTFPSILDKKYRVCLLKYAIFSSIPKKKAETAVLIIDVGHFTLKSPRRVTTSFSIQHSFCKYKI